MKAVSDWAEAEAREVSAVRAICEEGAAFRARW